MGLSTHEILLLLRARDEATAVLTRFGTMAKAQGMSAAAASAQAAMAESQGKVRAIQATQSAAKLAAAEEVYGLQGVRNMNGSITKDAQGRITQIRQLRTVEAARAQAAIGGLRDEEAAARAVMAAEKEMAAANAAQAAADKAFAMKRAVGLTTIGLGLSAVGVAGILAFNNMADAARAYDQQAALTTTQLDKLPISLEQIKKMGRDVASEVPTDFKQVQSVLYDIFSSIDTDAPGAVVLLQNITKAAVGGQAGVESVAKVTLAVLNAYKMKATDVTKVNDIMFQLVRKGVGTYQDFTNTIGRAIPSGVRAGQTFQTVAGMMAFLTRNGLSAASAAASTGRALDALSNPATAKNMAQYGVTLTDVHGKFLPLTNIIGQMTKALSKMNPAQASAALHDMFKSSGGTIQAMRFFNLAVHDSNQLLPEMVGYMNQAQGAAAQAYKTMSNTPEAKVQLLKNRFEVLKTEIGDQLIPIKNKLIDVLGKLVGMLDKIPAPVLKAVIIFALIAAGISLVLGVVLTIIGAIGLFAIAMEAAGPVLVAIMPIIGGVLIGMAALAVAIYLIIKYWKQIKAVAIDVWGAILKAVMPVIDYFAKALQPAINAFKDFVSAMVADVQDFLKNFSGIGEASKHVWNAFVDWIKYGWGVAKPILNLLLDIFKISFPIMVAAVVGAFKVMKVLFGGFFKVIGDVVRLIIALINGDWGKAWKAFLSIFHDYFFAVLNTVRTLGPVLWGLFKKVVSGVWDVLKLLPKFFLDVFMALNGFMLRAADKYVLKPFIKGLTTGFKAVVNFFKTWGVKILIGLALLPIIIPLVALAIMYKFRDKLEEGALAVLDWFKALPLRILKLWVNANKLLYGIAGQILLGFLYGLGVAIGMVLAFWIKLPGRILTAIETVGKADMWLYGKGVDVLRGIYRGTIAAAVAYWNFWKNLPSQMLTYFNNAIGWLHTSGHNIAVGLLNGVKDGAVSMFTWWLNLQTTILKYFVNAVKWLYNVGMDVLHGFLNGIEAAWHDVYVWFTGIPGVIASWIPDAANWLYNMGGQVVQGLLNGLKDSWHLITEWAKNATDSLWNGIKKGLHLGSPSKKSYKYGVWLIQGLQLGMQSEIENTMKIIDALSSKVTAGMSFNANGQLMTNPINGSNSGWIGHTIDQERRKMRVQTNQIIFEEGAIQTQEIDPTKHAADLGWLLSKRTVIAQ